MKERKYVCIDLKSFYASVECVDRGLDPMRTNLVVADSSRTEKTICLAVSPSMKKYGIGGRARLFEVVQKIREVNEQRRRNSPNNKLCGASYDEVELDKSNKLAVDYLIATPRMAHYIEVSTQIYNIYLKYVAAEDIHVYSIDEVFMDVTDYLESYRMSARELAEKIILEVINNTYITATAGIGTNMYLAKVAMDIHAKHIEPDKNGVRIAELDEMSYRENLWAHRPIIDFWRVGSGYAKKLETVGLLTMGDIAKCSMGSMNEYYNEDLLYKLFGVNAELLIDHAWGYEPCTMRDIKNYKPESNSLGSGQVLQCGYKYDKARLIVWEMADKLSLELVEKGLITDQLVLTVGYDISSGKSVENLEMSTDHYGRKVPKSAHGTTNLEFATSSSKIITEYALKLFERIVNKDLLIRRVYITANRVIKETEVCAEEPCEQLGMLVDYEKAHRVRVEREEALSKEKIRQKTLVDIQKKYGKNAALKASNLKEGATSRQRNEQIGGHKA